MANNNETVDQVALSDRPLAEQLRIIRGNYCVGSGEFDALDEAADVVECQQREIEAKDRQLEAASADAEAADAEIENLKKENARLRVINCGSIYADGNLREEIGRLRALVEGLLDASNIECATCDYNCGPNRENCIIRYAEKYLKESEVNK